MKSIIYHESLHNGSKFREHKLDKLFETLPAAVQDTIKHRINNIKEILPEIKEMFSRLRYDFEPNHIQGDYLVVFDLMEELKKSAIATLNEKPDP